MPRRTEHQHRMSRARLTDAMSRATNTRQFAGLLAAMLTDCPDCMAPAATPCRVAGTPTGEPSDQLHAARRDAAITLLHTGLIPPTGHPCRQSVPCQCGRPTVWNMTHGNDTVHVCAVHAQALARQGWSYAAAIRQEDYDPHTRPPPIPGGAT